MILNEHFNYILSTYHHPWEGSIVQVTACFHLRTLEKEKPCQGMKRQEIKQRDSHFRFSQPSALDCGPQGSATGLGQPRPPMLANLPTAFRKEILIGSRLCVYLPRALCSPVCLLLIFSSSQNDVRRADNGPLTALGIGDAAVKKTDVTQAYLVEFSNREGYIINHQ